MYYSDNSKYIGDWRNGKKHGRGTFTYADGSTFVGRYEEDQRKEGIYVDKDGNERTLSADD